MQRNVVSYISHEGISGGREHDSGYVPKELFRTRGAHRKSHQCAIKSARVATRRRIVLTLHPSRLFRSLSEKRTRVEAREVYGRQLPRLHLFIPFFVSKPTIRTDFP